jgi:2-oxoglutarate ferredoxin oxidoreductase subunit gamma
MVVNSSMINVPAERSDIRVLQIAGGEIAIELGDVRMTNMVLLGAMLAANSIVELSAAEQALRDHLPERKQHLVEPNIEVLRRGYRTATKE